MAMNGLMLKLELDNHVVNDVKRALLYLVFRVK